MYGRNRFLRVLVLATGLAWSLTANAQLIRTHPFLAPPSDYYVSLYQENELDALTMQQRAPGLPSDRVVEGRKLRVGYLRERGATPGSRLLIIRHYEKTIQAAGGEILYTTGTRTEPLYLGFRLGRDGETIFGEVDATAGGNDYVITTVSSEARVLAPPPAAQSPEETAAPAASSGSTTEAGPHFAVEPLTKCGALSSNYRYVAVSYQHAIVQRARAPTETRVCRWASGDNSTVLTHPEHPGPATGFGAYGAWGEPEGLLMNAEVQDPVRGRADAAVRLHRPLESRAEGTVNLLPVPSPPDTRDVNWASDLPLAGAAGFGGTWQKTASTPLSYTTTVPVPLTVHRSETRRVPTAAAAERAQRTGEEPDEFVYQATVWTKPYISLDGIVSELPMPAGARHAAILDAGIGDYSGDAQLAGGFPNGNAVEPSQLTYVAVGCTSVAEMEDARPIGYPTIWWSFDGRRWQVASHAAQTGCIRGIGQIGDRLATARLGGDSWRTEAWKFEPTCKTRFVDSDIPFKTETETVCDGSGTWVDGHPRRMVSGQLATVRAAGWLGAQPKPAFFEVDLVQRVIYTHTVTDNPGRGTLVYPCAAGWCLFATMDQTHRAYRFGFSQRWLPPPPQSDDVGRYEFETFTTQDLTELARPPEGTLTITECLRETYVEGKQVFACNGVLNAVETPLILRYVQ